MIRNHFRYHVSEDGNDDGNNVHWAHAMASSSKEFRRRPAGGGGVGGGGGKYPEILVHDHAIISLSTKKWNQQKNWGNVARQNCFFETP